MILSQLAITMMIVEKKSEKIKQQTWNTPASITFFLFSATSFFYLL